MVDMNTIFKNEQIVEFFHHILTKKELASHEIPSIHPFSNYFTNQYYLCTVIEFLMKYQILHKEDQNIISFAKELENNLINSKDYKSFLIGANRLLATSIQKKLNLPDQLAKENKEKILKYAYHNYIVEGFCFHSMPSIKLDKVEKDGIYPTQDFPLIEEMTKVDKIFKKYGINNIFGIEIQKLKKDYFEITDSPSLAFFYSILTPAYFSNFILKAGEKVTAKDIGYDRKNHDICSSNIELLCNKKNIKLEEKEIIMNYFNKEWKLLDASNLFPTIIMIKRKVIGRDKLDDYDKIISLCEEQDIIYSLSKIMDSRYPSDRRYSKLLPKDFLTIAFPSYENILHFEKKPVIEIKEEIIEKEETSPTPNNHGHADVIALLGLFLIALGGAWFFVSLYLQMK